VDVPAYTVMRQCGSGLQAVHSAAQAILAEEAEIVVAGGVESMSLAPYYLRGARFGFVSGNTVVVDSNTESQPRSQPHEEYGNLTMGLTAENLADMYDISREAQDEFALESQKRAWRAIEEGRFNDEIVPFEVPSRRGPTVVFDTDEYPRETSLEKLAQLPPVFKEGGSVTAGNSSGRNDGAACLVLMSAAAAKRQGIEPMATIRSQAVGLSLGDIGLIELNEAFAALSLAVVQELGLDRAIVNVNGGAIALGHPLGCSGARILTTLLFEMQKRGTRYGLATICVAGGQGMATVVETAG
jgi:acetyl-CoA C-acetyltransferase